MRWKGIAVVAGIMAGPLAAQEPAAVVPEPAGAAQEPTGLALDTVALGVAVPVAIAFLPDGRALLAERKAGRLTLLDAASGARTPIDGLPAMWTAGDAGLLDVAVAGGEDGAPILYLAYSAAVEGGTTLVLDRARLEGDRLVDGQRLFEARPPLSENTHYGGRIALSGGHLFLTSGDRETRDLAQALDNHIGKVVRLRADGGVPSDNPFVHLPGALPEIWSWGHRNPQGLALDPASGTLWLHEHGPRGGDEINVVRAGTNYGWPVTTYGIEYRGGPVGDGLTHHPGMEQPVYVYRPSIAPSGLIVHSGRGQPEWTGRLLVGAMALRHLNALTVDGTRVLHEERLLADAGWRVRAVSEGPDGSVWIGVDEGLVLRVRKTR